jgi:hypothetical protein
MAADKEVAMFVQVITGKVKDRDGVQRLGERWLAELRPGATGFLGATMGVAEDGTLFNAARFESRDAAMANSERPEQGAWWSEFEACLDGTATFRDSDDVTVRQQGDPDTAGFVQIMEGRVHDLGAVRAFTEETADTLAAERPDVLGDVQIVYPDGTFSNVVYFTSEAEARAAESKPPTEAMEEAMAKMNELMAIDSYIDLREPQMF